MNVGRGNFLDLLRERWLPRWELAAREAREAHALEAEVWFHPLGRNVTDGYTLGVEITGRASDFPGRLTLLVDLTGVSLRPKVTEASLSWEGAGRWGFHRIFEGPVLLNTPNWRRLNKILSRWTEILPNFLIHPPRPMGGWAQFGVATPPLPASPPEEDADYEVWRAFFSARSRPTFLLPFGLGGLDSGVGANSLRRYLDRLDIPTPASNIESFLRLPCLSLKETPLKNSATLIQKDYSGHGYRGSFREFYREHPEAEAFEIVTRVVFHDGNAAFGILGALSPFSQEGLDCRLVSGSRDENGWSFKEVSIDWAPLLTTPEDPQAHFQRLQEEAESLPSFEGVHVRGIQCAKPQNGCLKVTFQDGVAENFQVLNVFSVSRQEVLRPPVLVLPLHKDPKEILEVCAQWASKSDD